MAETALRRRYRLSRELARIRREQIAQGANVNQRTGKRVRATEQPNRSKSMTITAKEFEGLKPGMYPATLDSYEESDGEYGPSIKLVWALEGQKKADGEQVTKWQWVSQKLTPRSNLWNILKTFGATPVLGQSYEVDDLLAPLVGVHASLMIKVVDTPNGPTDKIVDMMAQEDAAPAPAPAKAPPAAAKKTGLASALRKEQPGDVNNDMEPCISCGGPADQFTGKGKPICADCK